MICEMNVPLECLIKLNLLIFLTKFSHRHGTPCRGWNVNIQSLDQSKCQDRQQTDGSICLTVRIEVGNFTSMNPIVYSTCKGRCDLSGYMKLVSYCIRYTLQFDCSYNVGIFYLLTFDHFLQEMIQHGTKYLPTKQSRYQKHSGYLHILVALSC